VEHAANGQHPPAAPRPPEEPTYRCLDCMDHGYTSTEVVRYGDLCSVSWFCDCTTGRKAEAGYWFDRCYPWEGNQRMQSEAGERTLSDYLRARPEHNAWLKDAVDNVRQKHEALRRRKLRALQERKDSYATGVSD